MKFLLCLLLLLIATPLQAAEWQVDRIRGEVMQKIGSTWRAINRGDLIPSDRYVRTGASGRVGLVRGRESIEVDGNSQFRIRDAGDQLMTTVLQDFGTVTIEAERRNVQHFSVQTPFLAAVVKGTRFTVRSDAQGARVDVDRGVVQVQDTANELVVDVRPGQEASVTKQAPLLVEGAGAVRVFSFTGTPVVNGTTTAVDAESPAKSNSAGGNGNGNAFGLTKGNGNGNSANSNAGGNGKGNSANSNAGGNGKGNSTNSNGGGNGNGNGGNSNAGGNGNSNSANSNAGGNGNGNSANSNAGDNGNSNAGGNAGGNGKSSEDDEDGAD